MKIIIFLVGIATMITLAGCEDEHEHHHHEGGAYDGYQQGYGHEGYRGDWDRDHEHER
jgi:hypothetical protein